MPTTGKRTIYKVHERVCAQLHFTICKEIGVKLDKEHWYENVPKLVEPSHESKVNVLLNKKVQTLRTNSNNKAVIIMCNNEKGMPLLIEMAVCKTEV
jgi:predicted hydrocarbon binding protein